ncbi:MULTISPECIES: CobW family GTP-binding protein [Paraburkholderia]|uniref:CobW family GTP-binding protein n=1 Tax=Paraburkholderia TaxID=1822464 RepID=UPI0022512632|nr:MULTISPECIES: GTP-binding protein [Paraburkholderia]MCX4175115.1 GTP-binding protein [Paraburkholderia madseniana]MDQ6463115.1 GTP-binding protein [Paraburkholderia madseniana]
MGAPTQLVILAGLLGSGKTSLVEAFLDGTSVDTATAVIVNEVGAVNIDGAVLSESAHGATVATLSNGCVCCSLTDDLVTTISDLAATREQLLLPPFERIVLECSGLSKPGQVMLALNQLAELKLRVHVVVTYDCSRPPADYGDSDDAVAQLVAAHTIVLTKTDIVIPSLRTLAGDTARTLNPLARVIDEFSLSARAREAFRDFGDVFAAGSSLVDEQVFRPRALIHPRVQVFRARFVSQADWQDVLDWLENIAGATGERLLRMKAIVAGASSSDRVLLQSVGTTFAAPRRLAPGSASETTAIFIVRDFALEDIQGIESTFEVAWSALRS